MDKCKWIYDEKGEYWITGCQEIYTILEGTPKENKMKFCCYCGKPIESE